MQYSLLDRRPEESCLDLIGSSGIGVLARGALAKGLLVGKPPTTYLDHSVEQVTQAAAAVHSLSGEHRSPSQTAIGFILQDPAVTTAVTGMRTIGQLGEIMLPPDPPDLTAQELLILRGSVTVYRYTGPR